MTPQTWRIRACEAERPANPDPFTMHPGDRVEITGKGEEGWVWCRNGAGKEDWMQLRYLTAEGEGTTCTALAEYDSTVLSVEVGEEFQAALEAHGWLWCESAQGKWGWVCLAHVERVLFWDIHPQSSLLLFLVYGTVSEGGGSLTAFEVRSGKQLWRTHVEGEGTGACVCAPDGRVVLIPVEEGTLLVYQVEDGACVQRLCSGLSEPVQALAFDHDGSTLWLATEERLVQYQPQG